MDAVQARQTLKLLDKAVEAAQDSGFRRHLGASLLGRSCDREVWYAFRWATRVRHPGRLLRLFGRGELEEARFARWLRMLGAEVYASAEATTEEEKQRFRITGADGHFGGTADAVARGGIVEIPAGQWYLVEMKTHNAKSFAKLEKEGLCGAKPEHFVQAQLYANGLGLGWCAYLAVCKDNDELYLEVFQADPAVAAHYTKRAERLVRADAPPDRISKNPAWYGCKFCDHANLCHGGRSPARNCRTCVHAAPVVGGVWACALGRPEVSTQPEVACLKYKARPL